MTTSSGVAGLQYANPATSQVSRKPQTTATTGAGASSPFVRQSRRSQIQGFAIAGVPFGGLITQPLKAVGGYLRGLFITVQATGGTGTVAVAAADAPDNTIASLFLRDPLGQPIAQIDGFGLRCIMNFSGQFGMAGFQDPHSLPSYSAIANTGNFTERFYLPLELDSAGYCCLPSLNAAALPTLTIQIAPAATVYSTLPTTVPTLTVTVDQLYWAAPVGAPNVSPPDVGSSAQWSQGICAQTPPSGQSGRLTMPRVGTYIHTAIAVVRDSTGARVDVWPLNDLTIYVDGVPVIIRSESEHYDLIYTHTGINKLTGVLPFTFRTAVQQLIGEADTHDELLPTTPATLLELAGTWQTMTNLPNQVTVYTGELYPVSGIPYTHLAS
jgi:hypothetical protein